MKVVVLIAALLPSTGFASTYVVDAAGGPGSQFTSIAAAVAASVPGDVLLVRDGTYSPFTLDRGLTLVGGPGVLVMGDVAVIGLPAFERAAIVAFNSLALNVANCQGPVIVQDFVSTGGVVFTSDADVRVRNLVSQPSASAGTPGIQALGSRLEIVDSIAFGAPRTQSVPTPLQGVSGMQVRTGSNVHALTSRFVASDGENIFTQFQYAPGGNSGVAVENSNLRIVGSRSEGSYGGLNFFYSSCEHDGFPGSAVSSGASFVHHSACSWFAPQTPASDIHCFILLPPIYLSGNTYEAVTPNDPLLRVVGTPAAGQIVTFEIDAPPSSTVNLVFGRSCLVHDTPPSYVEELSSRERIFSLGVVPASGKLSFAFPMPSYLPQGFMLVTQAEATLPGGELRRTNSAPLVLR